MAGETIDDIDHWVRHCEATSADFISVDEDVEAWTVGVAEDSVARVRVVEAERQMKSTVGIKTVDIVEAFWGLHVSLVPFGA